MYGPTITADQAKSVAAAAVAEARKNQWTMAVAIVDPAGDLVYFEKMDNTQVGSVDVAIAKARSSARFKRPTKAFQDALAAGGEGWRILSLDGAVAVEGGHPADCRWQDHRRHRRVRRNGAAGRRHCGGGGGNAEIDTGRCNRI